MTPRPSRGTTRRTLLATFTGTAALAMLSGCGIDVGAVRLDNVPSPPPLQPDATERTRAGVRAACVAVKEALGSGAGEPWHGELLEQVTRHIDLLGPQRDPVTGGTVTPPSEASAASEAAQATPQPALSTKNLEALLDGAQAASRAELTECRADVAALAAKIGATHGWWARYLGARDTPIDVMAPARDETGSGQRASDEVALGALGGAISVRHAAIYAYGELLAEATDTTQEPLRQCWQHHQRVQALQLQLCDELAFSPPAAEAAYTTPQGSTTAERAGNVERACVAADAALLYRCPRGWRTFAADLLDAGAAHYTLWVPQPRDLTRIT